GVVGSLAKAVVDDNGAELVVRVGISELGVRRALANRPVITAHEVVLDLRRECELRARAGDIRHALGYAHHLRVVVRPCRGQREIVPWRPGDVSLEAGDLRVRGVGGKGEHRDSEIRYAN